MTIRSKIRTPSQRFQVLDGAFLDQRPRQFFDLIRPCLAARPSNVASGGSIEKDQRLTFFGSQVEDYDPLLSVYGSSDLATENLPLVDRLIGPAEVDTDGALFELEKRSPSAIAEGKPLTIADRTIVAPGSS